MVNSLFEKYLEKYLEADTSTLAFSLKTPDGVNKTQLLTQIKLLQKAQKKLPTFYDNRCLLSQKSYEQSTSERVANIKSAIIGQNKSLLDLTGGLGVDDLYFTKTIDQVISIDSDETLNSIVNYNFNKLGIHNYKRITDTAEDFLDKTKEIFDVVYADPDQRTSDGNRKIQIKDWKPDILNILEKIKSKCSKFCIKINPIFDNSLLLKTLPEISDLYTISEKGEVKELFCIIDFKNSKDCKHHAIDIQENETLIFDEKNYKTSIVYHSNQPIYFYESGNALIKSNLWEQHALVMQLNKIEENTPYLISENYISPFMGRVFKIIEIIPYKNKLIEDYFKRNSITKANITRYNFNENVQELRKRWKLKEGGNDYLFFIPNHDKNYVMYHCRKVES